MNKYIASDRSSTLLWPSEKVLPAKALGEVVCTLPLDFEIRVGEHPYLT